MSFADSVAFRVGQKNEGLAPALEFAGLAFQLFGSRYVAWRDASPEERLRPRLGCEG